ncbi:hypothetical protein HWV62_36468 [Athelia sp. TMB]|nr:hypothetical protein HWV62_36468 [Athelia sp. TMB]
MAPVKRKHKKSKSNDHPESTEATDEERNKLKRTTTVLEHEVDELKAKVKKRSFYATRRFLFPLGILLGVLVGFVLIEPADIEAAHSHVSLILEGLDLPPLPNFDAGFFETEWAKLRASIPEVWNLANDGREFQVGDALAARGLTAHHPVVLVPGVVSTGLESWSTHADYRPFFRAKLWGGLTMVQQVTFNKERWISAMMLDPVTGLDPGHAKVRAAEGIDAASSFIQGYWLWSKIIENLAVLNYDTNNLHLAPYDWRLSYWNLEERDGYFSRLKSTIEGFKTRQGKKVVLAAHSMGSTVVLWVESPAHGGGGPGWVDAHVEALVAIAGTHLGVAKAMSAFLSGEMKDTVEINPAGAYVLERFFSRRERQKLFRSWAGSASMWIKGGEDVWGDAAGAPDDIAGAAQTHGELISFRANASAAAADFDDRNMTATEAGAWILQHTPAYFQKMLATNYSFGIERDEAALKANDGDHTKWTNPLEHRYTRGPNQFDDNLAEASSPVCAAADTNCTSPSLELPLARNSWIDAEYTDDGTLPKVRNGVKFGDGDGTVSLLSLGAMCVEGWKRPRWNPAGIPVTTIELPHRPVPNMPRGGANTSDHVDILGSTALSEIILKVAAGVGDEIEDSFVSDIREYAKKVKWD